MKRPNWHGDHPPACTCYDCNEGRWSRARGQRRRPSGIPPQPPGNRLPSPGGGSRKSLFLALGIIIVIVVIGATVFNMIDQWPNDTNKEEAYTSWIEAVQRTPTPTMALTPIPTPLPTAKPTTAPTVRPTPAPTPTLLEELRLYALDLINKDRTKHSVEPVILGSNPAAQLHAQDMIEHDYFGHWWADGRKPYMVYTETGGKSYAAENASTSGWTEREWQEKRSDSYL